MSGFLSRSLNSEEVVGAKPATRLADVEKFLGAVA